MNRLRQVNIGLLVALSVATGLVKIVGLPEEVALFEAIGIRGPVFWAFGAAQLIAGVGLIARRTRLYAATALIPTFMIASYALFASGVHPFSYLSIAFVAMAIVATHPAPPPHLIADARRQTAWIGLRATTPKTTP